MQLRQISTVLVRNLRRPLNNVQRAMSSSDNSVKSLSYKEYGEPEDVLELKTECLSEPGDNQVTVKWLYAPVNPADINTIQGKYPSKPPLPAVGGNEGVGEIVSVGPFVEGLCVGDRVIPNRVNTGTWRTCATYESKDVYKINKDLDLIQASTLFVNPCTAYRMLKDFVPLKESEVVIQNGANSAVGQMVIQIARQMGLNSVNIIRETPYADDLKTKLTKMGGNLVLTDDELRTTDLFKSKMFPRPKLALNCVCGKNALEVQRHLDQDGVMVTYGAMSREPLTVPASSLIFKNISFKGFWMTAWTNKNADTKARHDMMDQIQQWFMTKKLQAPAHKLVPLSNYKEAVTNALKRGGGTNLKYILDLTK